MKDFAKYFNQVSHLLKSFSKRLHVDNVSEEDKPFASYNMTLILLLSETTSSASILLTKKHYTSVASLLRIIIEGFFSLNWVTEVKNSKKEMNERIYRLEGNSLFLYEIELEKMEEDLKSKNPSWKPDAIKIIRDAIEKEKLNNPLLTETINGKVLFKSAPSMAKRMSKKDRSKYYHLYSFTSFFSHPTPKLKPLFLGNDKLKENLLNPLAETIVQCFQFIFSIIENAVNIFEDFDDSNKRKKILGRIRKITLSAIEIYKEQYKRVLI